MTKRQATSKPYHSWPELWRGMSKNAKQRERSINGQLKNQSSRMQDDCAESVSLYLRTKNPKKSFKTQGENWKHQWLQPCLARLARKASVEKPIARLMISSLSLHVSWKLFNPQECVWKNFFRNIMRTISQKKDTIHYSITIHMFQVMKISAAKAAVDNEWEKLEKILTWDKTSQK